MKQPSRKQEEEIAALLSPIFSNARRQPGSGNQATAPNDVRAGYLHIECKETSKSSIVFQSEWLRGVVHKALQFGAKGIVALRFSTSKFYDRDYVVIPMDFFLHLLHCEKELDEHRNP